MKGVLTVVPRDAAEKGFNGKVVMVTGGAGFLGSHICERVISGGGRVICVDNLETGRLENITALASHPAFSFVRHDVIEPIEVEGRLDMIFNMACAASPPRYQLDPVHTFKTSVLGVMNLLDLARKKGARFLQASTSEVYGDPEVSPQREDYRGSVNTQGPRSCYDEGKRAAETLIHDYHAAYGVRTRIARIFNTYGPRMRPDDGRVVSNFIIQALKGEPLTIYGDGSQTRSFCYVDDMVDGLIRLMMASNSVSGPVNLGNPTEFTILELAELIGARLGTRPRIVFQDLPVDDPRQRRPDITRARILLGWEPKVPLHEGLDRTISYFAAELGTKAEAEGSIS